MNPLRKYRLIAFLFELPFYLPVPDNSTSTVILNDSPIKGMENVEMFIAPDATSAKTLGIKDFVSLRFYQISKTSDQYPTLNASQETLKAIIPLSKKANTASSLEEIEKPKTFTTVIEAVSIIKSSKKDLTDNFEKSLNEINNFIVSYLADNNDNLVYAITKEDLPSCCFFYIWKLNNRPRQKDVGIFSLHAIVDYEKEIITEEQFKDLSFMHGKMVSDPAWTLGLELQVKAKKSFERSDFRISIIFLQINLESLIDSILFGIYWEEDISKNNAVRKIEKMRFKDKLIEIGKKFNEDWDCWNIKNNHIPTHEWKLKFYDLRNQIMHEGYKPNYDETLEALKEAEKLQFYILECLARSANNFPKTAVRFSGINLIKKVRCFTEYIVRIANLAPRELVPYQ